METGRKMEELLQAYARQRREQAGAPPELHPATRRMLLAEVARKYKRPGVAGLSWSRIAPRFLLKFAMVALALALVGVLVWISLPRPAKQTQLAKQLPAEKLAPASRELAPETPPLQARQEADQAAPAKRPTIAPPVAGSELRGLAGQVAPAQPNDKAKRQVEEQANAAPLAPVPALVPTPALPPPTQDTLRFTAAAPSAIAGVPSPEQQFATLRHNFQQAPAGQALRDREAEKPSSPVPVLNAFALEQTGNHIRIIDADGSVYEGELVAASQEPMPRSPAPKQAQRLSGPLLKQEPILQRAAPPASLQSPAPYATFRASGTNRTLHLPVIIEAALVPLPVEAPAGGLAGVVNAPASPAPAPSNAVAPSAPAQPRGQQAPLPRAILQGTVRIGSATQVPIEARPVDH